MRGEEAPTDYEVRAIRKDGSVASTEESLLIELSEWMGISGRRASIRRE